jgi:hypothetical protein
MAHCNAQRVAARNDVGDLRPRLVRAEGEPRRKLDVSREQLDEVGVGRAQLRDQLEVPAPAGLDLLRDADVVASKE